MLQCLVCFVFLWGSFFFFLAVGGQNLGIPWKASLISVAVLGFPGGSVGRPPSRNLFIKNTTKLGAMFDRDRMRGAIIRLGMHVWSEVLVLSSWLQPSPALGAFVIILRP